METEKTCPRCGAVLPPETGPDACPRCLMSMAVGVGAGAASREPTVEAGDPRRPAPTPAELAPHFPALEILDLLGQGGMGTVYRARQKGLDRFVALKILTIAEAAGAGFAERFAREAKALASLDHPNIVTVHDFGEAGGYYFLLMEFIEGDNLREAIRSDKIAPHVALGIVSQICAALQFAHDKGIVHRDIKPENILIDARGHVKIADFGLAKILGFAPEELRLTGSGQAMGTVHYMAPEQVEHPKDVDHRADIFSLGVVFYELLTGELPLGRFDPPSRKIRLDVRLDDVVLKTLEKEPQRRYQHANEVKTDVDSISSGAARGGAASRDASAAGAPAAHAAGAVATPATSPTHHTLNADPGAGVSAGRLQLAGFVTIIDAILVLPIAFLGTASWTTMNLSISRLIVGGVSFASTALFVFIFLTLRRMLTDRFGFRKANAVIIFLIVTHVLWFISDAGAVISTGLMFRANTGIFPPLWWMSTGFTFVIYIALGIGFLLLGLMLLQLDDPEEPLWKPLSWASIVSGVLTFSIVLLLLGAIAYVVFDVLLALVFFRVANRLR